MTTTHPPASPVASPVTERYPGETLHLLRSLHADMAYLREQFEQFAPLLDRFRTGGLLSGRRTMTRGRPPT